ncbi:MAG: SHOCT domain-containing protein [Nitrospirota bacterium]|jgi:putative membrane protein
MFGSAFYGFSLWWIFPIIMVVFCIFMMRGRMGCMMGGRDTHDADSRGMEASDSAMDVLDKRYALGEINKEEYEDRKRTLTGHS